jgi:hypothetical protein
MFHDQASVAHSFYHQALFDYMEACDAIAELYAEGKKPDEGGLISTGLAFSRAFDKLRTVVKIANVKFGTKLTMTHFVLDIDYWSKPQ